MILFIAWLTAGAGATMMYLVAPKQQLMVKPLPRPAALPALLLLIGAGWLFARAISLATAAYCLIVALMLFWTAGPLLVALWRRRRAT